MATERLDAEERIREEIERQTITSDYIDGLRKYYCIEYVLDAYSIFRPLEKKTITVQNIFAIITFINFTYITNHSYGADQQMDEMQNEMDHLRTELERNETELAAYRSTHWKQTADCLGSDSSPRPPPRS